MCDSLLIGKIRLYSLLLKKKGSNIMIITTIMFYILLITLTLLTMNITMKVNNIIDIDNFVILTNKEKENPTHSTPLPKQRSNCYV